MIRKFILSLTALACACVAAKAQKVDCGTPSVENRYRAVHPEVEAIDQQMSAQFHQAMAKLDWKRFAKKSDDDTMLYDIPIVVHIVHEYGSEYIPDSEVYNQVDVWNRVYVAQNPELYTSTPGAPAVIPTYVPYIGKANIKFHLANIDPYGQPTHGITRDYSYLGINGGNQAKLSGWPDQAYINIWVVHNFSQYHDGAAAYAYQPATASQLPYYDGVITVSDYFNYSNTVPHEIGHVLNLSHPWGNTNDPEISCGDDDVDDTPPTIGHNPEGCVTTQFTTSNSNGINWTYTHGTLYDTICNNHVDTAGAINIAAQAVGIKDMLNTLSIDFKALSTFTLDTVTIYPSAPVGSSFTIALIKGFQQQLSYTGTVTGASNGQQVPLNFLVTQDSNYHLAFTVNPGMLRDTGLNGYTRTIANVVTIQHDSSNNLYNYFYNWKIEKSNGAYYTLAKPHQNLVSGTDTDYNTGNIVRDNSISQGITFIANDSVLLSSVAIYPTAAIGSPFTIKLMNGAALLNTYTGTVATNAGAQVVPLNFFIGSADTGVNLKLVFGVNPGMIRDNGLTGYPRVVDTNYTTLGTVHSDTLARFVTENTGNLYNYFYDWKISRNVNSFQYTLGKFKPATEADDTHAGISFTAGTHSTLLNVVVYPTAPTGTPFTIELTNNNNTVIASHTDVVTAPNTAQRVSLGFYVPGAGTYNLLFSSNPGMLHDSLSHTLEINSIAGVVAPVATTPFYNYFYDWVVMYGYIKVDAAGIVHDYPDTVNAQNIMDYTYCSRMFTQQQVTRMRTALTGSVASRSNLYSHANLVQTGVTDTSGNFLPRVDLAPIADFSVKQTVPASSPSIATFICANGSSSVKFTDQSWNDTVDNRTWTFGNGAQTATSTAAVVTNTFTTPGWVPVTLTANSNAGSSTVTKTMVYAADPTSASPVNIFQEFNPGDTTGWPIFNYFNTGRKWELVSNTNQGYYDNTAIRYTGYDSRVGPATYYNAPTGDFADFFTPGFDFTDPSFATNCNINFYTAGAYTTTLAANMNDSLVMYYSPNCGTTWVAFAKITHADISNNGTVTIPFAPTYQGNWKFRSFDIPAGAKTGGHTYFRFRYYPGSGEPDGADFAQGTGNNFYLDRIYFSNFTTGIDNAMLNQKGVIVAPNPTHGDATVTIKGGTGTAQVEVLDVAGRLVYKVNPTLNSSATQVEIPASVISVKGLYLIHVTTDGKTQTEKLVVN